MFPTGLMVLLFLVPFVLAVFKFYTYYLNGMNGPYGVWLIGLLSAVMGTCWPVIVSLRLNSTDVERAYLTFGLALLAGITVMLFRPTPPKKKMKGLVISGESARVMAKIERERKLAEAQKRHAQRRQELRQAARAAARPPGTPPAGADPGTS